MRLPQTHHKHSSTKGYRRLLDALAEIDGVHRVATGRVKPRMGAGRPVAPISKVRARSSRACRSRSTPTARSWTPTWSPTGPTLWKRRCASAAGPPRSPPRAARRLRRDRQPRVGRVQQRVLERHPARLVQVGRAQRRHEVRCAGCRAPPPLPRLRSSRRSSAQQLLERLAQPRAHDATGTWCQSSPAAS